MRDIPENAFWIIVWSILSVAIIVLAALMTIYHTNKVAVIAKADHPLETACALSDADSKPCMAYLGSLK